MRSALLVVASLLLAACGASQAEPRLASRSPSAVPRRAPPTSRYPSDPAPPTADVSNLWCVVRLTSPDAEEVAVLAWTAPGVATTELSVAETACRYELDPTAATASGDAATEHGVRDFVEAGAAYRAAIVCRSPTATGEDHEATGRPLALALGEVVARMECTDRRRVFVDHH